jgi:hypothetical protein
MRDLDLTIIEEAAIFSTVLDKLQTPEQIPDQVQHQGSCG